VAVLDEELGEVGGDLLLATAQERGGTDLSEGLVGAAGGPAQGRELVIVLHGAQPADHG
jgi:hypothetical protein